MRSKCAAVPNSAWPPPWPPALPPDPWLDPWCEVVAGLDEADDPWELAEATDPRTELAEEAIDPRTCPDPWELAELPLAALDRRLWPPPFGCIKNNVVFT
mmetsp:Transcript_27119/g.51021  ORF Transcript_27119/g.51021 Transcript_27119/m.51021 type:complete len:100 (+) Transcript_27119:767-1066(+)